MRTVLSYFTCLTSAVFFAVLVENTQALASDRDSALGGVSAANPVQGREELSSAAGVPLAANSADNQDLSQSEIIITHRRLAPLSEWAKMQADDARYEALKSRFQADDERTGAAAAAKDRNAALSPSQREPDLFIEVQNMPTPPAIQAVEDATAGE